MKKTFECMYSNSMKINMGDYEQLNPFFAGKIVIEADGIEVDMKEEFENLRELVDLQLKNSVDNIKNSKKAKDIGNFRFYERNGLRYVSVTSVLNPEPKTPEEQARLKPYGDRGTALHRIFSHLITNGELVKPTKEEEAACKSVGGFSGYDFWFKDDERFDFRLSEVECFNDELLYAGRFDANGFFDGKPCIFDLKSGSLDKTGIDKAFMQLAAYNACFGEKNGILVVIPIGTKAKKEPIVAEGEQVTAYFNKFMAKREAFKKQYGV